VVEKTRLEEEASKRGNFDWLPSDFWDTLVVDDEGFVSAR